MQPSEVDTGVGVVASTVSYIAYAANAIHIDDTSRRDQQNARWEVNAPEDLRREYEQNMLAAMSFTMALFAAVTRASNIRKIIF